MGQPYLRCQCLIYTLCSCTKSAAVSLRGGNGRSGGAGQTWPPAQDKSLLFWVFFALWSDLDIQLAETSFPLGLCFHLSLCLLLFFNLTPLFCITIYTSGSFWVFISVSPSLLLFGLLKKCSTDTSCGHSGIHSWYNAPGTSLETFF